MHASAGIRCNRDQRKEPDVHGERAEFWEERRISWINIARESEISKLREADKRAKERSNRGGRHIGGDRTICWDRGRNVRGERTTHRQVRGLSSGREGSR